MKPFLKKLQPPVIGYQKYEVILMRLGLALLLYFNLPIFEKFPEQPEPNGFAALFGIEPPHPEGRCLL